MVTFTAAVVLSKPTRRFPLPGRPRLRSTKMKNSGGYGLSRWEHRFSGSDFALQAYFTQEKHQESFGNGTEQSLDFDFQHHLPVLKQNDLIWGIGYRRTIDRVYGNPLPFVHATHSNIISSLFFEDDYALVPNKLVLTGGFKLQHNSFSGLEIQPGIRVLWNPDSSHSIWAALSRAVRTPSIQERDLKIGRPLVYAGPIPAEALLLGNPDFRSEVVFAYEAGYRQRIGKTVSIDAAAFVNAFSSLRNEQAVAPYVVISPTPTLMVPFVYKNAMDACSHGLEAAVSWTPLRNLRFQSSYSWITARLTPTEGQTTVVSGSWLTPTNTLNLRGNWTFARRWNLFSSLYMVSKLEQPTDTLIPPVKHYERLDTHVSFSLLESLQFSAGGENLLTNRHPEFDPQDEYTVRSQVPRSAFVKFVWSF